MSRLPNLKTRIFVDGSDTDQTRQLLELMGFLDGQTTNPTNFIKSAEMQEKIKNGEQFSKEELLEAYKKKIQEISSLIPDGSVSIEVYADQNTKAEEMLTQAHKMYKWISNGHIKLPITHEGLRAAEMLASEGKRVNMTLCFTQEQAAAIYAATRSAKKGDVFISPFIGRLDDDGLRGIDLIQNIVEMYKKGDGHVEVLAASIRGAEAISDSIGVGVDILTGTFDAIKIWAAAGMPISTSEEIASRAGTKIEYKEISLEKNWQDYDISHPKTDDGLKRFADDWNKTIGV